MKTSVLLKLLNTRNKGYDKNKGDFMDIKNTNHFKYEEQQAPYWFWEKVMAGDVRLCGGDGCIEGVIKTQGETRKFRSGDTLYLEGEKVEVMTCE